MSLEVANIWPEAQVLYQLGRSANQSDGSPAPSPSGNVTNIHKSSFSFQFLLIL